MGGARPLGAVYGKGKGMAPVLTTRSAAVGLVALLTACGSPPPPPTVAQLTIAATADANPDPTGRASPTVVHVYALQPGAPFAIGAYDALTGGDLGELGETTKRIGRLIVVPGEATEKTFELPDGTSDIGVTAAFRQIETSKWRASKPVEPNAVNALNATIGANEVRLE
jgi:type VI secretion system protein VasD